MEGKWCEGKKNDLICYCLCEVLVWDDDVDLKG